MRKEEISCAFFYLVSIIKKLLFILLEIENTPWYNELNFNKDLYKRYK